MKNQQISTIYILRSLIAVLFIWLLLIFFHAAVNADEKAFLQTVAEQQVLVRTSTHEINNTILAERKNIFKRIPDFNKNLMAMDSFQLFCNNTTDSILYLFDNQDNNFIVLVDSSNQYLHNLNTKIRQTVENLAKNDPFLRIEGVQNIMDKLSSYLLENYANNKDLLKALALNEIEQKATASITYIGYRMTSCFNPFSLPFRPVISRVNYFSDNRTIKIYLATESSLKKSILKEFKINNEKQEISNRNEIINHALSKSTPQTLFIESTIEPKIGETITMLDTFYVGALAADKKE